MSFLFLFLFLGMFLTCFREGVWTMYSPEELAKLRASDAQVTASTHMAPAPVTTPTAEPVLTPAEPRTRTRRQHTSQPHTRRASESMKLA